MVSSDQPGTAMWIANVRHVVRGTDTSSTTHLAVAQRVPEFGLPAVDLAAAQRVDRLAGATVMLASAMRGQ